jgi:hypothetical protein
MAWVPLTAIHTCDSGDEAHRHSGKTEGQSKRLSEMGVGSVERAVLVEHLPFRDFGRWCAAARLTLIRSACRG